MPELKIATLWQPWASLMAWRAKRNETRSWRTHYRGVLAIHSSASFPKKARLACCTEPIFSVLKARLRAEYRAAHNDEPMPDDVRPAELIKLLPLSTVLAVGNLVDCIATPAKPQGLDFFVEPALSDAMLEKLLPPQPERSFGDYDPGRFYFRTTHMRPMRLPVTNVRGERGLWTPSPHIVEQIVYGDHGWEAHATEGYFRASGHCLCPVCGEPYLAHPMEEEILSYQDLPFLHRLCTGEAVKL